MTHTIWKIECTRRRKPASDYYLNCMLECMNSEEKVSLSSQEMKMEVWWDDSLLSGWVTMKWIFVPCNLSLQN